MNGAPAKVLPFTILHGRKQSTEAPPAKLPADLQSLYALIADVHAIKPGYVAGLAMLVSHELERLARVSP